MKETHLTGAERFFRNEEVIVSKTDKKGNITYANSVFLDISGYEESELIGEQHNILRHPSMPRSIFRFLWNERLLKDKEVFAYVLNRCKNGDEYWVFAHMTPSFDLNSNKVGYHSNRRVPDANVVKKVIMPLYKKLLDEEKKHPVAIQMDKSFEIFEAFLKEKSMTYDEFIFSLQK